MWKTITFLGPYGEVFRTFCRKEYLVTDADQAAAYCTSNGGVLSQIGSNNLGTAGMSWQEILRYYYTRVTNISHYYNAQMNYGTLVITTAHTHDWSDGYSCPTCGAIVE